MSAFVRFGVPYQLRDASGNVIWVGAAMAVSILEVVNVDGTTVNAGESVRLETTAALNTIIPRWDYLATDSPPEGKLGVFRSGRNAAGTEILAIGVALEPIAATKVGRIAGPGSITCVAVTAVAIAEGVPLVNSATIGQMQAAGAKSALVPAYGTTLGVCTKTNTVALPGTGSTAQAGVLVLSNAS